VLRASLLVVILGCGGRQPPPPPENGSAEVRVAPPPVDAGVPVDAPVGPLDQNLDRLAERSVTLYGEIVKAFDAAGENCGAAAGKLDQLTTTHAEVIAANAKVLHEGREMQLKIALRRFDDQFQRSAKAIVQSKTIAACFQDAAFAKALEGLVGPRP
jgi:hypothetical protein